MIERPKHLFRIEKNLKRRGQGANKEVLVHWKGVQRNTTVRFCITSCWLYNKRDSRKGLLLVTLPSNAVGNLFLLQFQVLLLCSATSTRERMFYESMSQ